ncbi:unnamed protein product [Choristocarpus tenellus]
MLGGGRWGTDVVAKAVADSLYKDPMGHVALIDMKEVLRIFHNDGLEEAQSLVKHLVCKAILHCPGKALVVFRNVHALRGESVLLLDPLLLLFDDNWSHMEYNGTSVSGAGSLFLLQVGGDDEGISNPSDIEEGMNGKEILLERWQYPDEKFSTGAFVGRIDGAFLLPTQPSTSLEEQATLEQIWALSSNQRGEGGLLKTKLALSIRVAVGTTAAIILMSGAVYWLRGRDCPVDDVLQSKDDDDGGGGGGGGGGYRFSLGGLPKVSNRLSPNRPSRHSGTGRTLGGTAEGVTCFSDVEFTEPSGALGLSNSGGSSVCSAGDGEDAGVEVFEETVITSEDAFDGDVNEGAVHDVDEGSELRDLVPAGNMEDEPPVGMITRSRVRKRRGS